MTLRGVVGFFLSCIHDISEEPCGMFATVIVDYSTRVRIVVPVDIAEMCRAYHGGADFPARKFYRTVRRVIDTEAELRGFFNKTFDDLYDEYMREKNKTPRHTGIARVSNTCPVAPLPDAVDFLDGGLVVCRPPLIGNGVSEKDRISARERAIDFWDAQRNPPTGHAEPVNIDDLFS